MHIVENKKIPTEVVEEKSEHDKIQYKKDNNCNICDKKLLTSLKITTYHMKQNIYKCDDCNIKKKHKNCCICNRTFPNIN